MRNLAQPTVILTIILMLIITMMILPVPAWVLDLGLTASFALAILIFTIVLFIERPLDFSIFPTVLLVGLLLRLSLNISSTKLIIGQGHKGTDAAGGIIEGFAMFIMAGNILMGLVIFGVLLIVNFMVITKGAGRMAEVGARFALDAMPGKQLAIDSDVASGSLSHAEAKQRRQTEQEETTFFGSLDGASKFVKGDAVAGLLITILNLVVGLTVGMTSHGLAFEQAISTYSILTVGDGLVSQIPSVITSIAAALLLSKGNDQSAIDKGFASQLGGNPTALATVSGLLFVFGLFPGLPLIPFVSGAGLLGFAAWAIHRKRRAEAQEPVESIPETQQSEATLGDHLDVDEIHIEVAVDLVNEILNGDDGFESRINNIRVYIIQQYGFIMPPVRLTDKSELENGTYVIRIQGIEVARGMIKSKQVMVLMNRDIDLPIAGTETQEPVFNAKVRWIPKEDAQRAEGLGFSAIEPTEALITHFLEILQNNFGKLMTRRALRKILKEFSNSSDVSRAEANKALLEEYVPDKVPVDLLQTVLRMLLEERVSVRNLPLILDAIAQGKSSFSNTEQICEFVRQQIGFQLVAPLQNSDGKVPLLQLAPEWETLFSSHEIEGPDGHDVALGPEDFNRLAGAIKEKIEESASQGHFPAIITSTKRRRFLKTVMQAKKIKNPVLSFEEFGTERRPALVGVVSHAA